MKDIYQPPTLCFKKAWGQILLEFPQPNFSFRFVVASCLCPLRPAFRFLHLPLDTHASDFNLLLLHWTSSKQLLWTSTNLVCFLSSVHKSKGSSSSPPLISRGVHACTGCLVTPLCRTYRFELWANALRLSHATVFISVGLSAPSSSQHWVLCSIRYLTRAQIQLETQRREV